MVTLPGSLHPRARPELDVGRLDPGLRLSGMSLLFRMSPEQRALQAYALAAVQDPASPTYHQWLTPEQYAAEFGASSNDIARAAEWLTSQGLTVDGPSRTSTRLAFSGTVEEVESAFQTEVHQYRVSGTPHFSMSRAPSVPANLASQILGLHGVHNFRATRARRARSGAQYDLPIPQADGGTAHFSILAPADFAKIYDLDSLYQANITGAGQSIAVVERSDFNDADVATFRAMFGLPDNLPKRVLVPSTGNAVANDSLAEAALDLEWSGAVAPDATVLAVFTGDSPNSSELDALFYAIEQDVAPVISTSFGMCEHWYTSSDASFLQGYGNLASLEGLTVVAAAGDTGAAACDTQLDLASHYGRAVLFPASLPTFLAVGGSQFQLTESDQSTYLDTQLNVLSYITESAWNETMTDIDAGYGGLGAGGGGASQLFSKPYWQASLTPDDGSRDVPDVALSASADTLPYAIFMSGSYGDAGTPQPETLTAYAGTSAAAPAFAGIVALLNQTVADANPTAPVGLGNVNPTLYALESNATSSDAFHDITLGDNIVPCEQASPDCPSTPPFQFGYTAGQGFDQVTGLGSIDAALLLAAWKAKTPTSTTLTVTAAGAAAGSPLHLTATVASRATADTLTGTVSFYFVSSDDGGVGASGTLGTAPIAAQPSPSGQSGTASVLTSAPGGLDGTGARVGAFYGGDTHYLGSWSSFSVTTGTSTLSICPPSATLAVGQTGLSFTTTGGAPGVRWSIHNDQTCAKENDHIVCSSFDGRMFTAGPKPGSATVVAIDEDESYATANVVVVDGGIGGSLPALPTQPCPPDGDAAGTGDVAVEASTDAAATTDTITDTGASGDASSATPAPKTGCTCATAGANCRGSGATCPPTTTMIFSVACGLLTRLRRHRRAEGTSNKRTS